MVGAGFAGTATAIRLLALAERPLEIVLIDRNFNQAFGGLAYSRGPASKEHLFNLQAGRISLFREKRDDFVDWLKEDANDRQYDERLLRSTIVRSSFVPRMLYQHYLVDRLRSAAADAQVGVSFRFIKGEVTDIIDQPRRSVTVSGNNCQEALPCNEVVLCTGNLAVTDPTYVTDSVRKSGRYFPDQYDSKARAAIKALGKRKRVVVLGSALRAYDVAMTLFWRHSELRNDTVEITMISRSGRVHPTYDADHLHEVVHLPRPVFLEREKLSAEEVVAGVKEAFEEAWRMSHLQSIRAHGSPREPSLRSERILKAWERYVPEIFEKLSAQDVRQLLCDYRSLITVHRIGVVPEIGLTVKKALKDNRLTIKAGDIKSIERIGDGLLIRLNDDTTYAADLVINCLGRERDYEVVKQHSKLWYNLFERGFVERHFTHIGIDVDPLSGLVRRNRKMSEWISAVGVMREGVEFEANGRLGSFSFTLGPIKNQAMQVALHLLWRLQGHEAPPDTLCRPLRPDLGDAELTRVTECFENAIHADRAIASQVSMQTATAWAEAVGVRRSFEAALNWLAIRTNKGRAHQDRETLRDAVLAQLDRQANLQLDIALKEKYFTTLWKDLEGVVLAFLTRLDQVEPEESTKTGVPYAASTVTLFVSYVREDLDQVELLIAALERRGVQVLWDGGGQAITSGLNWRADIRQMIDSADATVFCFSPNASVRTDSGMFLELDYAVGRCKGKHPNIPFLHPVILAPCSLPNLEVRAGQTLQTLTRLTLGKDGDYNAIAARLVRDLQKAREHGKGHTAGT